MISSFSLSTLPTTTTKNTKTSLSRSSLFSKTSSSHNRFKVSCNANATSGNDDNKKQETSQSLEMNQQNNNIVDRRNVLLGLGGMCGAANLTSIPSAFAAPIQAPDDIWNCKTPTTRGNEFTNPIREGNCSAPKPVAQDYVLPERPAGELPPRVRRPAHLASADSEYVAKYAKAIALMKALPDSDPHSWKNQAKIHTAYCNAGYTQVKSGNNFRNEIIQVHNSALFFPFHRWYLYFYERILGSLIKDPTFALPYWNWDHPDGMTGYPTMFETPMSSPNDPKVKHTRYNPLYDPYRNPTNANATINLQAVVKGDTDDELKNRNLATVRAQMIVTDTEEFLGDMLSAGPQAKAPKAGTIENGVHTRGHMWAGNPRMPYSEDMGNFYSAGYDPLFYCHHANVDRMWAIWSTITNNRNNPSTKGCDINGRRNVEACEKARDWENASYVFYDEHKNLVRVYNKQCVSTEEMGYTYADSDISPWKNLEKVNAYPQRLVVDDAFMEGKQKAEDLRLPVLLNERINLLVRRPAINRTKEQKDAEREILYINRIESDDNTSFSFDVHVNDRGGDGVNVTAINTEFAGSFEQLPHGLGGVMNMSTGTKFGITGLLEKLGAEGDQYVLVSLVPGDGCERVTVSDIRIELLPIA